MAYNEQDFDSFFSAFNSQSSGGGIKELYNIMPFLTQDEVMIINDGMFFAERYGLEDLKCYLNSIIEAKRRNRSLGFLPSFKQFLKYMTLEEKVKAIKVQAGQGDTK